MRRLSKRLGVAVEELKNVREVRIFFENGEVMVFDYPKVSLMKVGGTEIFQVMGDYRKEKTEVVEESGVEVSEEDVQLVAQQAGVSMEEAREALKETKGDLAEAVMLLTSRKTLR